MRPIALSWRAGCVVIAFATACAPPSPPPAAAPMVRYIEVPVPVPSQPAPAMVGCPQPGPEAPPPRAVGPDERRVRFVAHPAGARLELDGEAIAWFGTTHVLRTGEHALRARVPASACCEATDATIRVLPPPDGDRDSIQIVHVRLPLHDATATLVGAPPDGYAACDNGVVVRGSGPAAVVMDEVSWTGSCAFLPGGRQTDVTFEAGRATTLQWPGSRPPPAR